VRFSFAGRTEPGKYGKGDTDRGRRSRKEVEDGRRRPGSEARGRAVAACEAAGGIGAFLSREGLREWYPKLQKSSLNPLGWVFGPTWTLLYALMGASLWLAEERGGDDEAAKRTSRFLFGAQLLLNVLWTYVFFGRRAPGWAFVEILVLLAAVAATALSFSKTSKTAALPLAPYLLWICFASVLNFSVWRLNR
jgi:benzodiazapine receptor